MQQNSNQKKEKDPIFTSISIQEGMYDKTKIWGRVFFRCHQSGVWWNTMQYSTMYGALNEWVKPEVYLLKCVLIFCMVAQVLVHSSGYLGGGISKYQFIFDELLYKY